MEYIDHNYELLDVINNDLINFYTYTIDENKDLNLQIILDIYNLYCDINIDKVANAICWCVNTLLLLKLNKSVRSLDEVISFAESVLKEIK